MAYLGNKPVNNFVSFAKQNITGNGGTSYSLDYPVTGANDIELFINNVRQEPTEAYSCAGSTLTLTGAVSSTDDVYVIFRGRALQTAQHPSDSALEAASAIIDTNTFVVDAVNNRVGIGTSAPSHLADVQGSGADQTLMRFRSSGTSSAAKLEFLGTNTGGSGSQVAHITVSQPSGGQNTDTKMDFLVRKSGDAFDSPGVGLSIDRGMVTMPRQPSFEVSIPQTWTSTATSTYAVTQWGKTHHNIGNHFDLSNGRFTAPVDGVYQFHGIMMGVSNTGPHIAFGINGASNGGGGTYTNNEMWAHSGTNDNILIQVYHIIELSAGDYVRLYTYSYNSVGNSARSYFGGHLLG